MFTGIVTDLGRVKSVRETNRDRRFEIETGFDLTTLDIGASVSHAGCCLTVIEKGEDWFAVEVSGETLSRTTLSDWRMFKLSVTKCHRVALGSEATVCAIWATKASSVRV